MSVIKGYSDTNNILLVDNLSCNFEGNQRNGIYIKNGIPIRPFNLRSMCKREFISMCD